MSRNTKDIINRKYKNSIMIKENFNGITLISLVITIILLIILAGIVISFSLGSNGIFNRAKQAKEQYEESIEREKLEIALINARIEKEANKDYNNQEFLNNMLKEQNIIVNGEVATVGDYNFKIDRENLKILEALRKSNVEITTKIQGYLGKNVNEKYEANILLTIESNSNIESIIINPDGTTFEIEEDIGTIEKDITVEFDKEYEIIVTTKDGKKETKKIIENSEEIIRTPKELAEFRDKVNTGLTYEGKTIKLGNDIDLSTICGRDINGKEVSWVPIYEFKGIFDGQNNLISNMYINVGQGFGALFYINGGVIQNVNISGNITNTANYGNCTASISCYNNGTITRCINNAIINSPGPTGGIVADNRGNITQCTNKAQVSAIEGNVGGITGINIGEIRECYNTGSITATATNNNCVGGITGTGAHMIYNCYNRGNISGKYSVGGITGVVNGAYKEEGIKYTYNSYNIGKITGTGSYVGQITGRDNYVCTSKSINCYTTNVTTSNLNGGEYSNNVWLDDGKKIDKDGNIVDNLDENGNIKYINDRYPILKWQVQ